MFHKIALQSFSKSIFDLSLRYSDRFYEKHHSQKLHFRSKHAIKSNEGILKIGVVGSRRASPYAKNFLQSLMLRLQGIQAVVVSGGAFGVDQMAHYYADQNNVSTEMWLVGPIERPNPASCITFFNNLLESDKAQHCLIVPETLDPKFMGRRPVPRDWLRRNQWLVASCDLLIVVEATKKSGSLSSASAALEYGVETWALPGSIFSNNSAGCLSLVSQGRAHMIDDLDNFVEYLFERAKNYIKHREKYCFQST